MKFGTIILVIMLIFVSSYIGLGYMISQFDILAQENQELKEQIVLLKNSLNVETTKKMKAQADLAALTQRNEEMQIYLASETATKEQAVNDRKACEVKLMTADIPSSPLAVMALPLTAGSLLGVVQFGKWMRRRKALHSNSGVAFRDGPRIVTVQMTREQLKKYLRFQRHEN